MAEPAGPPRGVGPGRVLVGVYGLFVAAAGARSAVQLATHPHDALLAYVLSAVAAAVYAAGLVLVVRVERCGRGDRAARGWCAAELAAVVAVGTWTLVRPASFPQPTVWSDYGAGYLLVPLALPVLVLVWLRSGARVQHRRNDHPASVSARTRRAE